ncbi:hypothetical protein B0H21DRAFT_820997 [Amylocystis lapponica]|nr:hypothetical protein B0H21DRAFT_820997 [Amylocystis lapponica]
MPSLKKLIAVHAKSVYTRITLTPFTTAFFLLSLVSCVVQCTLQGVLHSIDAEAAALLSRIVEIAQVPQDELAWLTRTTGGYDLRLCKDLPIGDSADSCRTVLQAAQDVGSTVPSRRFWDATARDVDVTKLSRQNLRRATDISVIPSLNETGGIDGVNVTYDGGLETVFLSTQCTDVLLYPRQVMELSKRQDWALFASQFWLFAISSIALVYNSIPQLIAVICTRLLATAWSAYAVWLTQHLTVRYHRLVVDPDTPCHLDIFPAKVWTHRAYDVAELVVSVTTLVFTCYLGWYLIKAFNSATIRRVGPPPEILRIYRYFLAIFVFLQLSVFFMLTAICLWIDQLVNSAIRFLSHHTPIYDALFIFTIVTLVPWMAMGWFAVRREMKYLMMLFLFVCFLYVLCWSIMFYSQVYRWVFIEWPFLGCMTIASFLVLVGAAAFGVVCWLNFDKGLAHYLHVEDVLARSGFVSEMFAHDMNSPTPEPPSEFEPRHTPTPHKIDEEWDVLDISHKPVYVVELRDTKAYSPDPDSPY